MIVLLALFIVCVVVGMCAAMVLDVTAACADAERERQLDEIWADDGGEVAA